MKNKINLAELLKDCPKGMELDCTMYDNLYFNQIYDDDGCFYKIGCYTIVDEIRTAVNFTEFGTFTTHANSKCVIFPKGKTTWEGFVPLVEFKDGDILCNSKTKQPFILKFFDLLNNNVHSYCGIDGSNKFYTSSNNWAYASDVRLATKEEKEKLFKAIKDNGYNWNPETKTLDKLIEPKFHEGDWVVTDYGKVNQVITVSEDGEGFTLDDGSYFSGSWKDMYHLWTIQDAKEGDVLASDNGNIILVKESRDSSWGYRLSYHCAVLYNGTFESREFHVSPENFLPATKEQRELLFQKMKEAGYEWNKETNTLEKLVKPKFKVGDIIQNKETKKRRTVTKIHQNCYECDDRYALEFENQDYWELVPNKFDITTLIPFESKVLVRNDNEQRWIPAFWGGKREDGYVTTFGWSKYCIPYEGNKHLLDKTDDCDEYYKTWK